MLKRMYFLLVVAVFASALVLVGSVFAQKQPLPRPVDKRALAEDQVK